MTTRGLGCLLAILLVGTANAQKGEPWRYDLRAGDHLVYRYTLQRQISDGGTETEIEAHYRTHVLVAGNAGTADAASLFGIGFERVRESATMTGYHVKGKDKLSQERPNFLKRMQARPSRFSEAMIISLAGEAQYSWEFARESGSQMINQVHEVMDLPPAAAVQGEVWHAAGLNGMDARWTGDEVVHGKACHRIEASSGNGVLKFIYWWSPESGVLEQLEFNLKSSGTTDQVRMELDSRSRDEKFDQWLASAETRDGALQILLLSPEAPVSEAQLTNALGSYAESDAATSQALALAVARRRGFALPTSLLGKLRESSNEEVRGLAEEISGTSAAATAGMECGKALPAKKPPVKYGTVFDVVAAKQDQRPIPYLMRIPLSYRPDRATPLIVYLSGGDGRAIDGVSTADDVVSSTGYLVLYPHGAGYWWTPQSADSFDEVLRQVLEQYNVDRDRIYLTGFSNGGTGSLYFASQWPQRFAAVVSLMGAGVCNEDVKPRLAGLANLPILFVHGDNDPLIDSGCSTRTYDALVDQSPSSFKPELKILPGHAHDIALDADDGLALAFFKDRVRNPFPRDVKVSLSNSMAARSYWIEILHGEKDKSAVEARVKSNNTLEIHSHDVKQIRLYLRPELFPHPGPVRIEWNGKKMFEGPLREACSITPGTASDGDPKFDLADTRELTLP